MVGIPQPLLRMGLLYQNGVMLLEALIGVFIFSVGILALIGLQTVAVRETTEAKFRSDASYLADRFIGDLSAAGSLNLAAVIGGAVGTFSATSNPASPFSRAVSDPVSGLPSGQAVISIAGNTVTITITWQTPRGQRSFSQTAVLVD